MSRNPDAGIWQAHAVMGGKETTPIRLYMAGLMALQALCFPPELRDSAADLFALIRICRAFEIMFTGRDTPIGSAIVLQRPDHYELYSVEVHPEWRRRGIARNLIDWATCEPGIYRAYCLPDGALTLFRCGFRPTGESVERAGHNLVLYTREVP